MFVVFLKRKTISSWCKLLKTIYGLQLNSSVVKTSLFRFLSTENVVKTGTCSIDRSTFPFLNKRIIETLSQRLISLSFDTSKFEFFFLFPKILFLDSVIKRSIGLNFVNKMFPFLQLFLPPLLPILLINILLLRSFSNSLVNCRKRITFLCWAYITILFFLLFTGLFEMMTYVCQLFEF